MQNHIENSSTREVIYTPPNPKDISRLISNWEKYVHGVDDTIDPLIKCAISHYQFEAIHPFNDGNGRTGRILIVLYLIYNNLLDFPILYISGYITKNRAEYYKLLQMVTTHGEWVPFIEYMLKGFYFQAKETKEQLFKLMALFYETKDNIKRLCGNVYNSDLVGLLFSTPIITPVKLGLLMDIHYTTATRYLKVLHKHKFLEHRKVGKYQIYVNKKLINTLNGYEVDYEEGE